MEHPKMIDIGTNAFYLTLEDCETILNVFYDLKNEYGSLSEKEEDIVSYLENKKFEIERNLQNYVNRTNRS